MTLAIDPRTGRVVGQVLEHDALAAVLLTAAGAQRVPLSSIRMEQSR